MGNLEKMVGEHYDNEILMSLKGEIYFDLELSRADVDMALRTYQDVTCRAPCVTARPAARTERDQRTAGADLTTITRPDDHGRHPPGEWNPTLRRDSRALNEPAEGAVSTVDQRHHPFPGAAAASTFAHPDMQFAEPAQLPLHVGQIQMAGLVDPQSDEVRVGVCGFHVPQPAAEPGPHPLQMTDVRADRAVRHPCRGASEHEPSQHVGLELG